MPGKAKGLNRAVQGLSRSAQAPGQRTLQFGIGGASTASTTPAVSPQASGSFGATTPSDASTVQERRPPAKRKSDTSESRKSHAKAPRHVPLLPTVSDPDPQKEPDRSCSPHRTRGDQVESAPDAEAPPSGRLSLRERLEAKRAAEEQDAAEASVPDDASLPQHHGCLGGLSLDWRLAFKHGAQPKVSKANPGAPHPSSDDESSRPIASPCREPSGASGTGWTSRVETPPSQRHHCEEFATPTPGGETSCKKMADPVRPEATGAGLGVSGQSPARSVKELKALLALHGVEATGCVEKAELDDLWRRFDELRNMPLDDLRAMCVAAGGEGRLSHEAGADECARLFLVGMDGNGLPTSSGGPQNGRSPLPSNLGSTPPGSARRISEGSRELDSAEVSRVLSLRKDRFSAQGSWGLAVLGVQGRGDAVAVQRAYRALVKKLHPDKVGHAPDVARAFEILQEAKQCCERAMSQLHPPRPPRNLTFITLCASAGRRRMRLEWIPPEQSNEAPVQKYVVAAVDPTYGRAITIAILEPDYDEELRRFVPVEELGSYLLVEEDLKKMPGLFQQAVATLQVASANESGQSAWVTLRVPLREAATSSPANGASTSAALRSPGGAKSSPTQGAPKPREFDELLKKRKGSELRPWLNKQTKLALSDWLRWKSWPSVGSKEDLVDRVAFVIEGR